MTSLIKNPKPNSFSLQTKRITTSFKGLNSSLA